MRFNVSSFVPVAAESASVLTQKSVDLPAEALAALRGLRTLEGTLRSVVVVPWEVACASCGTVAEDADPGVAGCDNGGDVEDGGCATVTFDVSAAPVCRFGSAPDHVGEAAE